VAFIDSAGLGALVGAVRRAGGDVVVASPRASVTAVLEGTGFDRLATIVRTVAEAEVVLTTGPRLVKAG
jgi:anti-anti-sigma factor